MYWNVLGLKGIKKVSSSLDISLASVPQSTVLVPLVVLEVVSNVTHGIPRCPLPGSNSKSSKRAELQHAFFMRAKKSSKKLHLSWASCWCLSYCVWSPDPEVTGDDNNANYLQCEVLWQRGQMLTNAVLPQNILLDYVKPQTYMQVILSRWTPDCWVFIMLVSLCRRN